MATKLIKFNDQTLVEVEVPEDQARPVSGGIFDRVSANLGDKLKPVLLTFCHPIIDAWKELNKEMHIEQAEIEIGLNFEGEGNLYVTKSKAGANLTVKLILKPETAKR